MTGAYSARRKLCGARLLLVAEGAHAAVVRPQQRASLVTLVRPAGELTGGADYGIFRAGASGRMSDVS